MTSSPISKHLASIIIIVTIVIVTTTTVLIQVAITIIQDPILPSVGGIGHPHVIHRAAA